MERNELVKDFTFTILTYLLLLVLVFIIQIEYTNKYFAFLLIAPPIPAIIFFWKFVKIKKKPQRDVIKALNDAIIYIISGIVALFGLLKTMPHVQFDIFDILLKNDIGYLLLCFYSILIFIKAYVAICETRANIKLLQAKKDEIE